MRADLVRRKLATVRESAERLRTRLPVSVEDLLEGLGRLDDFDAFVADVEQWLSGR
ncbi:MAG TPA: hypothetical protein VE997_09575 [Candidatus Limnocylindria bacterium]|nr:hypothetical protein [Candidatus Limnocylindria bacterium]